MTSRTQLDKKEVRTQLAATAGKALAQIDEIRTVAVDAEAAVAALEISVAAQFDNVNATVTQNTTAIATLDGYAAGTWGVAIDVNGNVTGIVLANDSENFSVFSVTANNFRVAFPGATGGAAIPVFQISNVGGVPKIVFRGDMIGDGSILTQNIAAGAITTIKLDAQAVTAAKIQAGAITSDSGVIGALSVKSLSIGDHAVTTTKYTTDTNTVSLSGPTRIPISSLGMTINTAGLAGKLVSALVTLNSSHAFPNGSFVYEVKANGATIVLNQTSTTSFIVLTGTYEFVAPGGNDSLTIDVSCGWEGGSGFAVVTNRTLTAIAAYR